MGDAASEPVTNVVLIAADRAKICGERRHRDPALGEAAAFIGNADELLERQPVAKVAWTERGHSLTHVGALPELEDEMSDLGPDGLSGGASPDRVDALVWALTDLLLRGQAEPRIRWV